MRFRLDLEKILSFDLERPFMKKIQLLAACTVVLAMIGVARADTDVKPAAITVVAVNGEARYSVDGQVWHPLVIGKILRAGVVLETASGSSCDLVLSGTPVPIPERSSSPDSVGSLTIAPDPNVRGYTAFKPLSQQNVVRMTGGSMLAVDTLSVINTGADTVGDTELDLRAGKIFFSVKKLSASSQYIIKLPNGVAGIRGAFGSVASNDEFDLGGGTGVLAVNGQVFVINGGQGYNGQAIFTLPPYIVTLLADFQAAAQTLYQQIATLINDFGNNSWSKNSLD
jgi:hypothetical protein